MIPKNTRDRVTAPPFIMNRNQKITFTAVIIAIVMALCFAVYFYVFSPPSLSGNPWGGVSDPNGAKIVQLQNRVKKADELALRGSRQMADEEYLKGA